MMQVDRDKQSAILSAAYDVFINYGFRKTSMDDIARVAGMSRPALYQLFRNKTDIFRALSMRLLDLMVNDARNALRSDKPFGERLFDAIDASILAQHRKICTTPHGVELMGVNDEFAGDLEVKWCATMTDTIAAEIEEAHKHGEISLDGLSVDAEAVAAIIMQALEGLKADAIRGNPVEQKVERLITFVANALVVENR